MAARAHSWPHAACPGSWHRTLRRSPPRCRCCPSTTRRRGHGRQECRCLVLEQPRQRGGDRREVRCHDPGHPACGHEHGPRRLWPRCLGGGRFHRHRRELQHAGRHAGHRPGRDGQDRSRLHVRNGRPRLPLRGRDRPDRGRPRDRGLHRRRQLDAGRKAGDHTRWSKARAGRSWHPTARPSC